MGSIPAGSTIKKSTFFDKTERIGFLQKNKLRAYKEIIADTPIIFNKRSIIERCVIRFFTVNKPHILQADINKEKQKITKRRNVNE